MFPQLFSCVFFSHALTMAAAVSQLCSLFYCLEGAGALQDSLLDVLLGDFKAGADVLATHHSTREGEA